MKRVALLCLSLLLATALTLNASAFRGSGGRGGGGGVYRGGGGAGAIRGPGGGGAVRGPMGGGAAVGAAGGAAVRGPMGGGVARGSAGGAAVRGPMGGGVAAGPAGNVAVRGPAGNVAVGNTNVYRGSYTNVYGGAYPYYGLRRRGGRCCRRGRCWRRSDSALLLPPLPAALLSNSLWTAIHAGYDQLRESEGERHATPVTTLLVSGARRMRSCARGGASPSHPIRGKLRSGSRALRQPNGLR